MKRILLLLLLLQLTATTIVAVGAFVVPRISRGRASLTTEVTSTTRSSSSTAVLVATAATAAAAGGGRRAPFVLFADNNNNNNEAFFLPDDSDEPDDAELAQVGQELSDLDEPVAPAAIAESNTDDDDDEEDDLDIAFDEDDDDEEEEEVLADGAIDAELEEEEDEEEEYYEDEPAEQDDDWNDSDDYDDDDGDYELQDDDDVNYMIQKKILENNMAQREASDKAMQKRQANWADLTQAMEADEENFEDFSFLTSVNEKGEPIDSEGGEEPSLQWNDDIQEKVKAMMNSENGDFMTISDSDVEELSSEDDGDDTFVDAADKAIQDDLEKLQRQQESEMVVMRELEEIIGQKFDGHKTNQKSRVMDVNHVAEIGMSGTDAFDHLSEQVQEEIADTMSFMGSASYNVTKWLVYDLDFNVTNLMLAACHHNPQAPILFEHWFPQLQVCERYQYTRDRNFDFTPQDCANADMEELYKYYRGFGFMDIPKKAPSETGIIEMDELDEDELQMVDFAAWCHSVYNSEWDRKDFDDDDIKDMDNIYSPQFIMPQHPDLPSYEDAKEDIRNWKGEIEMECNGEVSEEAAEYRDMVGQEMEYTFINDEEFKEAFRGHLIIACTSEDEDLEVAEKITARFEQEFGKKIYVETRVMTHAILEDMFYEIWLESYEVELLHSKKRATTGAKDWTGPGHVDDAEMDRMVERAAFLISDEARYSYRLDMDAILS